MFENLYYVYEEKDLRNSYIDYDRAVNCAITLDNKTPWHEVYIIDSDGDEVWSNRSDGE